MLVVERNEISQEDLLGLFDGNLTAVRVPGYYPEDAAAAISMMLLQSELHGKYENAPNIGRVGQAFFESQANEQAARRYERDAVRWVRELRSGLFPQLTPIDRFRLELDEVWPEGSHVGSMNGHKMFVGLARTFSVGSYAEPHQDVFQWDAPGTDEARRVTTQVAMNVYLQMPETGGDLTLWPISYKRDEYEQHRIAGSYGVQRDGLPDPVATLKPRVGELILFNANKVHAVEEIRAGVRVTWSCFVGYQCADAPLVLWS